MGCVREFFMCFINFEQKADQMLNPVLDELSFSEDEFRMECRQACEESELPCDIEDRLPWLRSGLALEMSVLFAEHGPKKINEALAEFAAEWMIEGKRIAKRIGKKHGVWLFLNLRGKIQFRESDRKKAQKAVSEVFADLSLWGETKGAKVLMDRFCW